ncbi:class I SAM-dependent methyltransferase [Candidatus Kuenenbacteria bacterium]|nr:class I SAM-dependent methyltransferase [Candidatus Kuenenbacteria bacterium]
MPLDNLSTKPEEYFTQTRPEMLDFIPKSAKKILDVGCGSGLFSEQLKKNWDPEIWGVELDKDAAELAKDKIDKVLVGDIFQLLDDLPGKYFDCIIFNDLLEHLADPYRLLLKMKEKLTTNGIIVCSLPNVRYFPTLMDLLIKKQWKYEDAGILDKTHLRFFTQKSIIDMFNLLDYKIIKMEGINAITSWKFALLNILSLGYLTDTKYLQFASVVKPNKK